MPVQIDPGSYRPTASASLSQRLFDWSSQIGQERAQKQVKQAYEEGLASPGEKKKVGFIGGKTAEAFNKGARDAYVIGIDQDNTNEVNRIATESEGNLDNFDEIVTKYRNSIANTVDPVAKNEVLMSLDSMISRARGGVEQRAIKQRIAQDKETRNSAYETYTQEAIRLVRNGDQAGSTETLFKIDATLSSMVESGDISAQERDELFRVSKTKASSEAYRQAVMEMANEDIEGAYAQIEEISKEVPDDYNVDEWDRLTISIRNDLSRKAKEVNNMAVEALKDYEKANSLGFSVDPSEKIRVKELVSTNPELKERFELSNNIRSFSMMSVNDRQALLARAQTGQLADVDQYAALNVANNQINKMAKEDGLSLAYAQGVLEFSPFEVGNPESFGVRISQSQMASEHYGVPVSPLTDQEAEGISNGLIEMTADEKVGLAMTFQEAPEVWGQLAGKQAHVFAMAGATGDKELMKSVFKGQELLDAGISKPVRPADYLSDFNDYIEGVYKPDDAQAVLKSAIAYYAQTSEYKDGTYDKGDFESAIDAVTGGIAKINGYKIELPRGVDESDFEDFIDEIQPQTVRALGGVFGMSDEQAAELISQSRLEGVKSGGYKVMPRGNEALFTPEGKPFILIWDDELVAKNAAYSKKSKRGR